jgi:hypothetical protein
MNSLDASANRVADAYKSFKIEEAKFGKQCSYNPETDEITLNFETIKRYLDIFKILHELSHRDQKTVEMLYGNSSLIELNANKIAAEAYKKLGYPLTYEVTRHINFNNIHHLDGDLTQREIIRMIAGKKELIWRLPA